MWVIFVPAAAAAAAAITILYFSLTRGEPAASWLTGYNYAHRGLHGNQAPENSMRAFELAAREGYGIELDVRLSLDGQPVVMHDANVFRMTGMDKRVSDLTAEELSHLRLAGSGEGVPLFVDVLKRIAGRTPLMSVICHMCEKAPMLLGVAE